MSQTTIILSKETGSTQEVDQKEDEKVNITGIKKERKSLRSGEIIYGSEKRFLNIGNQKTGQTPKDQRIKSKTERLREITILSIDEIRQGNS